MKRRDIHKTGALGAILANDDIAPALDTKEPIAENKAAVVKAPSKHSGPSNTSPTSPQEQVRYVDPNAIYRWAYKDRPENELGDLSDLANSLKEVGQQQPCIVRPLPHKTNAFELIAGERRWQAAKLAKIKLTVIVKTLSDHDAALCQAAENMNRQDLSDFARGKSFATMIDKGILVQKDLTETLGISKVQVTRLLSFSKIPTPLFNAIGDLSRVSSRTAYEITRLAKKGEQYIEWLIELAPRIATGKCGHSTIEKELKKKANSSSGPVPSRNQVRDRDGRHLFTWRLDNNAAPSIHFPKDIVTLMQSNSIEFDEVTEAMRTFLSERLTKLK